MHNCSTQFLNYYWELRGIIEEIINISRACEIFFFFFLLLHDERDEMSRDEKKPTKEQNDDVLYSFRLHTSQEFLLFIITIFLWWWKNYSAECHMWNFLGRFKIKETRRMKRRRSVKDLMQLIANFRMCDSTKLNEKQEISTACKVYTLLLIDDDLFFNGLVKL